jgi:hypothetical protein
LTVKKKVLVDDKVKLLDRFNEDWASGLGGPVVVDFIVSDTRRELLECRWVGSKQDERCAARRKASHDYFRVPDHCYIKLSLPAILSNDLSRKAKSLHLDVIFNSIE